MAGLRKIGDIPTETGCTSPRHDPPSLIYLENGIYEYVCPKCGRRIVFTINRPKYETKVYIKNSKTLE